MNINVLAATGGLIRGQVAEILETGEIIVTTREPGTRILCDFLQTTHGPAPVLEPGDPVLFLPPAGPREKGVVLGRIGAYQAPDLNHVTVEANATLTLKCGDVSLLLRKDGKLLTRALDIATIAGRTHRIKGGSVEIN